MSAPPDLIVWTAALGGPNGTPQFQQGPPRGAAPTDNVRNARAVGPGVMHYILLVTSLIQTPLR